MSGYPVRVLTIAATAAAALVMSITVASAGCCACGCGYQAYYQAPATASVYAPQPYQAYGVDHGPTYQMPVETAQEPAVEYTYPRNYPYVGHHFRYRAAYYFGGERDYHRGYHTRRYHDGVRVRY